MHIGIFINIFSKSYQSIYKKNCVLRLVEIYFQISIKKKEIKIILSHFKWNMPFCNIFSTNFFLLMMWLFYLIFVLKLYNYAENLLLKKDKFLKHFKIYTMLFPLLLCTSSFFELSNWCSKINIHIFIYKLFVLMQL